MPLMNDGLLGVLYNLAISKYSFMETLIGMLGNEVISANAIWMIKLSMNVKRFKSQLRAFSLTKCM